VDCRRVGASADSPIEKDRMSGTLTIRIAGRYLRCAPRTRRWAPWRRLRAIACVLVLFSIGTDCPAAELEQKTLEAFHEYVHAAGVQMDADAPNDASFLFIDHLDPAEKTKLYGQIENGSIVVLPVDTTDNGKRIKIPDGMIHHWAGVMFARGITLQQVEALILDYSNYGEIYRPTIRRGRVLSHSGDTFNTLVQFYSHSPEMAFDAHFDVHVFHDNPDHTRIRSISTHVNQLQSAGNPDSPVMPDGQGNGYLWRLNDYWRLEQKDGGVFVQIESIELSRSVPYLLSWIIDPIVRDKSRDAVSGLLSATRRALFHQSKSQ